MSREILLRMLIVFALAVSGMIYEKFSHGVYSEYMIYAFLIPFAFSLIPACILYYTDKIRIPDLTKTFIDCGTAFLTGGCIFKGILEIYGTSNGKMILYPAIGIVFYLAAAVSFFVLHSRRK